MEIIVNVKQLGKRKDKVSGALFFLENKPDTVKELICECVKTCVKEYNLRFDQEERGIAPLSQEHRN